MSRTEQTPLRVILFEGHGAEALAADQRLAAVNALLDGGYAVTRVTGEDHVVAADGSCLLVMGRFPENRQPTVNAGDETPRLRFQDVTGWSGAQIVAAAGNVRAELAATKPGAWIPWFPVIDYERCTNCMQCLSFCLFGVYGVDADQRIRVETVENCKTNCPACSRVCPEAAIVFPKYKAGPINGDEVSDADLQREKMKIDISALLGGDIYDLLRQRGERAKSRFSPERDADKALQERQKCLVKLVEAADIPPEVLMALPSPEEIQRQAEAAKARTQAWLNKPS